LFAAAHSTAARRLDVEQLGGRVDSPLFGVDLDHPEVFYAQ
jgi:hypothetical protein